MSYETATDIKIRQDQYCFNPSSIFSGFFSKGFTSIDQVANFFLNEIENRFTEVSSSSTNIHDVKYVVSEGYIYMKFLRNETKGEYENRKHQEEKQNLKHLDAVERKKIKEKEALRSKYNQYKNLEEFFKDFDESVLQ